MRLNKAYEPAVKYMDLFVLPIATIIARCVIHYIEISDYYLCTEI